MRQGWLLAIGILMSPAVLAFAENGKGNRQTEVYLQTPDHLLTLNEDGQLFFDVHRIGLTEKQQDLMMQYHQTLMLQASLKSEIQAMIPVLSSWKVVPVKSDPMRASASLPNLSQLLKQ